MSAAFLAAFADPDSLLAAARTARRRGWTPLEAFTPFPIEALDEILDVPRPALPWIMLSAATAAGVGLYLLQAWSAVHAYPFDVGGRPLNAWPTFVIASVEFAILAAGVAGFVALLFGAGLPSLHHPLFDHLPFERASQDQFLLALPSGRDKAEVRQLLFDAGAAWIEEVAW